MKGKYRWHYWVISGLSMLFAIGHLAYYLHCSSIMSTSAPIKYSYINTTKKMSRGTTYQIHVSYNRKMYDVDITKNVSTEITANKMPALYYSKFIDTIFSEWMLKRAFCIFIVFSVMAIALFLLGFYSRK